MTLNILNAGSEGASSTNIGANAHVEGRGNLASGAQSHAEGSGNTASGQFGHAEGYQTYAQGAGSHAQGFGSNAFASYTHAGGQYGKASVAGSWVHGFPGGGASYPAQCGIYGLWATTTANSTSVQLSASGAAPYSTPANNLMFNPYTNVMFDIMLTARRLGTATTSVGWRYAGMVARDSGNARLVGTVTSIGVWSDATIGTVGISIDTANQVLAITVTPNAATQTMWQAVVLTNEIAMSS